MVDFIQSVEITLNDGTKGFALIPKEDCPHFQLIDLQKLSLFLQDNRKQFGNFQCEDCQDISENWICLSCQNISCSRAINSHMISHNQTSKHSIVMSFTDLSFWCYECNSYICNQMLINAGRFFSSIKQKSFKENLIENQLLKTVIEQKTNLIVKNDNYFTYDELVSKLKKNKYENICFILGTKTSEASGIQNIKTQNSTLLKQLEEFQLPYPERVFEMDQFKKNPEPLYKLTQYYIFEKKQLKQQHVYKFIKWTDSNKKLASCFTQNIDGLEFEVGITPNKIVPVNGHFRSARCLTHKKDVPLDKFKEILQKMSNKQEIKQQNEQNLNQPKQDQNDECLIKPDIILQGECLPQDYFLNLNNLKKADLVFIVGLDLLDMPFAASIKLISKHTPIVFVETNNVIMQFKNSIISNQTIENFFEKLLEDVK